MLDTAMPAPADAGLNPDNRGKKKSTYLQKFMEF
jgi:hypothetical protein